jgi:hypothetical protein
MKSTGPRNQSKLPDFVIHRLDLYAVGAAAAGVGLLAFPRPAQAKIIYKSANIPIPINAGVVELDLNGDGVNDFAFSNVYRTTTHKGYHFHDSILNVAPAQSENKAVRFLSRRTVWGAALPKGHRVGLDSPFQPNNNKVPMVEGLNTSSGKGTYGPWANKQAAYLGLEFLIQGEIHYGWARLAVNINSGDCKGICATLTGYAYETVPGRPIIAGRTKGPDRMATQPGTLGHLAQGASAISAWRPAGGNQ